LVTALRKLGVQVVQAGEFLAAIAAAPPGIDT